MQHGQGGYSMHRVKVYRLSTDGQWEDHGTGHIALEYLEQSDAMGLIVLSEADTNKTLLVHKIKNDTSEGDIYQRAGESTIITWHDSEVNTDFAVSFQEQVGCDTIWQQIQTVRRADSSRGCSDLPARSRRMLDDYDSVTGGNIEGELPESEAASCSDLPPPELGQLEALSKVLVAATPFQRERIASQLLRPGYLTKLLDLFKQCEDLEDSASLGHMYRIIRAIVMLNDAAVLEELLREDNVMHVLGALEYDPDLRTHQRHREFLQSCVQFKQVVPITDHAVLAKIHQTYRIQYLKDVILPRTLDDATYATLSSLALFNNVEVISALQQDSTFLSNLFSALQSHGPGDSEWHDLVAFLQEFCSLARHLQQGSRQQLFSKLVQLGMFDVVTRIMQYSQPDVKLKATDVLMSFMIHDIDGLRHFLLHQNGHALFKSLIMEVVGWQPFQQGNEQQAGKDSSSQPGKDKPGGASASAGGGAKRPEAPSASSSQPGGTGTAGAGSSAPEGGGATDSAGMGQQGGDNGAGSTPSAAGPSSTEEAAAAAAGAVGGSAGYGSPTPGSRAAAGAGSAGTSGGSEGGADAGAGAGGAQGEEGTGAPSSRGAPAAGPSGSSHAAAAGQGSAGNPPGGAGGVGSVGAAAAKAAGGAEVSAAVAASRAGGGPGGGPAAVAGTTGRSEEDELGTGGMSEQVLEMLKSLLDTETMESFQEKDEFLELFYDQFLIKMLTVLSEDRDINRHGTRRVSATMLGHVIEVFSFCVQHHGYRSKYFILRQNVVEKVLRVMRRREKWLACAAIRFVRVCMGTKDEFYLRYLVRNNLFEPIMNAFFENGDRYNLLNSAVLDLVDLIRRDNLKEIIEHLVKHFSHKFDDVTYVDTFKSIKLKYEQAQEAGPQSNLASEEEHHRAEDDGGGVPIGAIANIRGRTYVFNSATGEHLGPGTSGVTSRSTATRRRRREDRELDRDEENYFKEDDYDDDDYGGPDGGDTEAATNTGAGKADASRAEGAGGTSGASGLRSTPAAQPLLGLLDYYGDDDDDEDSKGDDKAGKASPVGGEGDRKAGGQQQPADRSQQRTEVPSRRQLEDSKPEREEGRKRLKAQDSPGSTAAGAGGHAENGRLSASGKPGQRSRDTGEGG